MSTVVTLAPDESVPGRPFTDASHTVEDLLALTRIRRALVDRLSGGRAGGSWVDASGAEHWLVLPDPEALRATRPASAVGFFGQARIDVDHAPIVRLEHELLDRASSFPGLLAYHNVRFAEAAWGNLVVFADDAGPGHVRGDARHLDAIARTPRHYRSIRLHRVRLAGGALGDEPFELWRTAYHDFGQDPPWQAVRLAPR